MREEKIRGRKILSRCVLYPTLMTGAIVLFIGLENLLWRISDYYPSLFTQVRYVDDLRLLTPLSMREICSLPLTYPELLIKKNGIYLRCGTPGIEGVYRIEKYSGD